MTTCRALGCAARIHALALLCPKHARMVPPEALEGAIRPAAGLHYLTPEQVEAVVAAVAMAEVEARQAPQPQQLELAAPDPYDDDPDGP